MSLNPVIIIPGIGQSKLIVEDKNGKKIKNAWPVEIDEKALLNDMKGSLMKMMLFRTDGGFSDKVAGIVNDVTDPLAVNPDGSKKYIIKPVELKKSFAECIDDEKNFINNIVPVDILSAKTGEDKIFCFSYDFFGDIEDTAASLDEFVSFVKAKTGSEKVDFVVYSIGGAVLKAYLKDYSVKCDCGKVVNIASALDGSSLVADIFENMLHLENPIGLLSSLGGKASSVSSMAGMLPGDVIENVINKSIAVLKKNLLDNCTTLWALIPDSRFEAVFNSRKTDDALAEKVKAMHEYSKRFKDEVKEKGIKFYQLCGYGDKLPSVIESSDVCSDGIVDTASASFGGAFPETTWYFKNQNHIDAVYNDIAMSLAVKILTGEIENVTSSSDYPEKNGSRNIKKLMKKLIPEAEKALKTASENKKTELEACIAEYEKLLSETVIENDDNVKLLEKRIEAIIKE